MKRLSINQRLKKAKSTEAKMSTLNDWTANWEREQMGLLVRLSDAIEDRDVGEQKIVIQQLFAVTEKRLGALPAIFERLVTGDE